MRKVVCGLLCMLALISGVQAIEGQDPQDQDIEQIQIHGVSLTAMLSQTDAEALDDLFFPTDMKLPTKYLDIFTFSNKGDYLQNVSVRTYEFLTKYYPTAGNVYTYAEYRAAQMYCGWYDSIVEEFRGTDDVDIVALRSLLGTPGFGVQGAISSCELGDVTIVQEAIRECAAVLEPSGSWDTDSSISWSELYQSIVTPASETGMALGMLPDFRWDLEAAVLPGSDTQRLLASFYSSRPAYLETMGLKMEATDLVYFGETAGSLAETPGGTESPVETQPIAEEVPPKMNLDDDQSSIDFEKVRGNKTITDFATGLTGDDVTERKLGTRDIAVGVALIVVLVTSVTLGFIDWQRRRRDPTRRYKR